MADLAHFVHSLSLLGNKMSSHGRGEWGTCIGQILHWELGILLFRECAFILKYFWAEGFSLPLLLSTPHHLHFSYFLSFLALDSQISGPLSSISSLRSSVAFSLHSSLPLSHLDLSSPYSHLNLLPSSPSLPPFLPLCSALQGSWGDWPFSNSGRGICTQPQPHAAQRAGRCVMAEVCVCVCLSDWRSASGNNEHVTGTPTLELPTLVCNPPCDVHLRSSVFLNTPLITNSWVCFKPGVFWVTLHPHPIPSPPPLPEPWKPQFEKNINEKALILLLATTDCFAFAPSDAVLLRSIN